MVFSSMVFLWLFLPAVLVTYYICPQKGKNLLLVAFSLLFYAWGEPKYIVLMILSVTVNYISGLLLERCPEGEEGKRDKKRVLFGCVAVNLLLLGYFKYFNFVVQAVNGLWTFFGGAGTLANFREIALPIGISFYTFQALSYVVDVYRGETQVQKSYINMLLYVSFFPQLIAGPIVKYHDIAMQMDRRYVDVDKFVYGIRRFICGLGKKVLLSNTFAEVVDQVYGKDLTEVASSLLWLTALLYMLQIYFDFSGYSDMAIGLGKMFGFDFLENFNLPYRALSVRDFWRRWHISLSSWFRDYLYIPLGGSRKGTAKTYRNLLIVFFMTGLWHGAGWSFILWGLYHGFFLVLERAFLGKALERTKPAVGWLYTLAVVFFGWILFRAESLETAVVFIKNMFVHPPQRGDDGFLCKCQAAYDSGGWADPLRPGQMAAEHFGIRPKKEGDPVTFVEIAGYMAIFWLSVMLLVNNTYNPFIYFRF